MKYAPYRCILLEPYKISTLLRFIDGGSIGSTPGGPGGTYTMFSSYIKLCLSNHSSLCGYGPCCG